MKNNLIVILSITALLFLNSLICRAQQWIPFNADDTIGCIAYPTVRAFYADTAKLYLGGGFLYGSAACDTLNEIGSWDGSSLSKMGYGFYNGGDVRCLTKYKGKIYSGGGFVCAKGPAPWPQPNSCIANTNYFARWNNGLNSWEEVPSTNGYIPIAINDMVVFGNLLIVGADIPIQPTRICAYDGLTQQYVNIGNAPSNVLSLEVYNGELYTGGTWLTLQKYNGGTSWSDIANVDYYIQDMDVDTFNNFLYFTGGFNYVNSILTDHAALWNGYYFEPVGNGCTELGDGISICVYHGEPYLGFDVDTICGVSTGFIAKWDGSTWLKLGSGINGVIEAQEVWKDTLYCGGTLFSVDGQPQKALARWYEPLTGCNYIKPRVFTLADTFKINSGQPTVNVQFYNNNAYVDTWAWDFGDTGTGNTQNPTHTYTATGTYNVSCTVAHNACIKTANKTIVVIDNTGIEDYTKESLSFKLYPNPTDGDVTVECTLPPNKKGELKTHNANGSMKDSYALQGGINKIRIPSTGLVMGVSLVSVFVDGEYIFAEKIVKQ